MSATQTIVERPIGRTVPAGEANRMMTVQEIEAACDAQQPPDLTRHMLEAPELTRSAVFYPFGFSAEVRTNSEVILEQFDLLWSMFEKRFDTKPIVANVCVVETESTECPPAPTYRYLPKAITMVADADNFGIADFEHGRTWMVVSTAALRYPLYLRQFFLECAVGGHIATNYVTPVHAGCVVLDGRGVLLCGDSGAGKSSLSYACARAGWGYVSDDASFLLNGGSKRIVIGDCHKVRFRPSVAELFPEMAGMEITPRAEGKPSIVVPTATMPHVTRRESAHVDYVVFLNRHADGPPQLVPYRKDVARHYMHQVLYGWPESLAAQHAAIDRMLAVDVFEMRYRRMDWAVDRLQQLVREGR
jgi:hypothetical protein